jgi:hypothetical protein
MKKSRLAKMNDAGSLNVTNAFMAGSATGAILAAPVAILAANAKWR